MLPLELKTKGKLILVFTRRNYVELNLIYSILCNIIRFIMKISTDRLNIRI